MNLNIWRLISIGLVFFLIFTVWYIYEFNTTTRKNIALLVSEKRSLEQRATELALEKKALQEEIAGLNKEKKDLNDRITDYETRTAGYEEKVASMSSEMDGIKTDIAAKDTELSLKGSEIETFKKLVEDYKKEIGELNAKLSGVTEELKAIKAGTPGSTARTASGAATLEPITVTPKQKLSDVKVLEVNKKYGFLAINAGEKQGVNKGDSLCIFRNKALLGRVVVDKVGEEVSIAKILYKSLGDNVKEGDVVTY